jgi:ATP-dependent Clp protease ATP-binding subunit ClpA
MRLDKLTVKLQEALQEVISFATELGHHQVEPEHLFYALLKRRRASSPLFLIN